MKGIIANQRADIESKLGKENIIERERAAYAERFLKHPNILAILGVRRCGKSIFSVLVAKKISKNFGYVNFDDERLVGMDAKDLDKVLRALYELYGDVEFVVLDEPQNVEKWELFASRLRETKKVIITGSNSRLLGGELATALTGRHIDVLMFPFSFREILKFKPNVYLTKDISRTRNELEEYLKGSGFPEYLKFGPEIVINIYNDIIGRDCIRRYRIRNEKSFRELSRYLISNFSSEFTYSKLSRITGIRNIHTVKNYVGYMEQAFLIKVVERFSFKLKQQIIAPKKVYAIDHGFANFLSFKTAKNLGGLFENVVLIDLLNRTSSEPHASVYYYKSAQGHEVDFIVKKGNVVEQLIQVCYDLSDPGTKEREIRSLLRASSELMCKNLLVITDDNEGEESIRGKTIKFIPLWKWLLGPVV